MRKKNNSNVVASEKPSRWSRVVGAAKRVASVVKSAVVATAKCVASVVKSAVVATARATVTVARRARSTWCVVVAPTLRSWGKWTATLAWITAALLAPLPTVIVTLVAGVVLIGMSRLINRLDASGSLFARVALGLIEVVGHAVLVAFYAMVVVDAILFPPLAIVMVLDMVMRARAAGVVEAVPGEHVSEPARFLEILDEAMAPANMDVDDEMAADQARPYDNIIDAAYARKYAGRQIAEERRVEQQVARGAEEMMDELNDGKCHACGVIDTCLARSQPLPYARTPITASEAADPADVPAWFRDGDVAAQERTMLCGECYAAENEEIALALTGVSLKATNIDIRLNERGLAATRACAASLERTDCLHWEATGWWRDRKETLHERAWTCFHAGTGIGRVSFSYKKRMYVAATTKVLGTARSIELAKRLVNDELMDAGAATSRMLQALAGMSESAAASVKAG